jgi:hypothetical protein
VARLAVGTVTVGREKAMPPCHLKYLKLPGGLCNKWLVSEELLSTEANPCRARPVIRLLGAPPPHNLIASSASPSKPAGRNLPCALISVGAGPAELTNLLACVLVQREHQISARGFFACRNGRPYKSLQGDSTGQLNPIQYFHRMCTPYSSIPSAIGEKGEIDTRRVNEREE